MNDSPRNVAIVGATGSIGASALQVLRAHPARFRLSGIAARRNQSALDEIAAEFEVPHLALFSDSGTAGLSELVCRDEVDVVLMAAAGTAGVEPTIDAIRAGKTIALASKEILVLAGRIVMAEAKKAGATIIPVDSEHSALFQCLQGISRTHLYNVRLTASGGPFLHKDVSELADVTLEEALRHPTWEMGPKITVDSATMGNKALEMIEARWLFDLDPDQVEVVIHPQSLIHSLVELVDGSLIAQAGPTSMTFPIQLALGWPDRYPPPERRFDWSKSQDFQFLPPDEAKFPLIAIAKRVMRASDGAAVVFNAANENAVRGFLDHRIKFSDIPSLVTAALEHFGDPPVSTLNDILNLETETIRWLSKRQSDGRP